MPEIENFGYGDADVTHDIGKSSSRLVQHDDGAADILRHAWDPLQLHAFLMRSPNGIPRPSLIFPSALNQLPVPLRPVLGFRGEYAEPTLNQLPSLVPETFVPSEEDRRLAIREDSVASRGRRNPVSLMFARLKEIFDLVFQI